MRIEEKFGFVTPTMEGGYVNIEMPTNPEAISVGFSSSGLPCVVASVDPSAEKQVKKFFVCGKTYSPYEQKTDRRFIGEYQIDGLTFHLFEVT